MVESCMFFISSLLIIWISIPSLKHPGSHGFYRFFAWEAILGMFLLNVRNWFIHPFAWYQIISWILLITSLFLFLIGFTALKQTGLSTDFIEETTRLVQVGIYSVIRHPLYASLLFLSWGIFFKSPGILDGCLAMISTVCLYATARADESECMTKFGEIYTLYMKRTKRFIPFLF
jgi:protein-S-isoprenylcysteine O-methyltransferase Ste14